MRTRWVSLAVLVTVAAAGCGGGHMAFDADAGPTRTAASTPEPSATMPPGPAAFIAEARTLDLGDRDMVAATDETILGVGRAVCRLFDGQDASTPALRRAGYEIIVQYVRQFAAGATEEDARTLTRSAVINLCPVNADVLEPGAVA